MSDYPTSKNNWNDDDLPVLTELAPDELEALSEQSVTRLEPVKPDPADHPIQPDVSLSSILTKQEPITPAEEQVTPSSMFPFELLLVSDEQEQKEITSDRPEGSPHVHTDALSMIEHRLATMRAGTKTIPTPSLSPTDSSQKPTQQVAVLGETALTEALYQAVLPRVKAEIMVWMQELLAIQTQQLCEGVLRQFKTDYEVMFGDALRDSLRQAVHEVRRQPLRRADK